MTKEMLYFTASFYGSAAHELSTSAWIVYYLSAGLLTGVDGQLFSSNLKNARLLTGPKQVLAYAKLLRNISLSIQQNTRQKFSSKVYKIYLKVNARSPSALISSGVYPLCIPPAICRSLLALIRR